MSGSHRFVITRFAIALLAMTASTAFAAMQHEVTMSTPASTDDLVEITDLQPFTHSVAIPAGGDVSSIKIESVKAVMVPTRRRSVTKSRRCDPPASDPDSLVDCRHITDESYVLAYRVTYSYRGETMASDEYANTYFTFSVYFHPDEISPELNRVLSFGKANRAAAAEFFQLTTHTDSIQQVAIDAAKSTICGGNYVDGNWVHTSPNCEDAIAVKTSEIASPYITVKVSLRRRG